MPGPGRGFHVPHQRDTTGLGALSTPGTAVLTPAGCRARPAPAASQRPVPTPRCNNPPAEPRITRHQRRFTRFTRPACPLPVIPGWNEDPRASLQAPHPAVTSDARQRRGHDTSTRRELRLRHQPDLQSIVHSQSATSCRNGNSVRFLVREWVPGRGDNVTLAIVTTRWVVLPLAGEPDEHREAVWPAYPLPPTRRHSRPTLPPGRLSVKAFLGQGRNWSRNALEYAVSTRW